MEFNLCVVFSWLLAFLACIVSTILLLRQKTNRNANKRNLPPGKMGLPLVGETMDFYKAQKNNRLFEEFVQPRMLKHGNVFKTNLMGSPTVIVNGAEANKFLLSNEFKLVISSWPSSSVQLMGKNSIMGTQEEQHRRLRALLAPFLTQTGGLEAMVPRICDSVESHLQRNWYGKEQISLYRSTKALTFSVVFECLFGINVEPEMLIKNFEGVLEGVFAPPISFPGSKFSRAKRARKEIEKMMEKVVEKKRSEMERQVEDREVEEGNRGMLLQHLVAAMIRGEMAKEEVIDNVVLLVFAAHDTTSFAIAMMFKMVASHPSCYARLLQEHEEIARNKRGGEKLTLEDIKKMKYSWQVARESMRLFPPIFGSFRKAVTDIEFRGFTIPEGWKVLWTAYGTHYNAEYFPEPKSFDPSRFEQRVPPYVFLPFGGGPRACAGYQVAKLNMLIFLHLVVTKYNWSLLDPNETIRMDPLPFPSQGMPILISPKQA